MIIGITNQTLTQHKKLADVIQPYDVREKFVEEYCKHLNISFEIVELTDFFGPTVGQRAIDCLIITELTVDGAENINRLREEKKLPPLPIKVCTMLRDSAGEILNSTSIREGRVNREGFIYLQLFDQDIQLSESQRNAFIDPWGKVVSSPTETHHFVGVVGDVCVGNFIKNDWRFNLGVFDLMERRQTTSNPVLLEITPNYTVFNKAGSIQHQAVEHLVQAVLDVKKPQSLIRVQGEEDLLAVALMMILPLESRLYYGQPDVGMIEVIVTEEIKENIRTLFG